MRGQNSSLEKRARGGDAAAFGALIREYDHDLRGMMWSILRTTHGTDDVMQTAYEKAFRSIRGFDGRSSLKTWVNSICYRAAIDHIRHEQIRRHDDVDTHHAVGHAALAGRRSEIEAVEDQIEVDAFMALLEPEERALLMMTVGLGYSFDETAEIVGMKRGTVASKVSRARSRLGKEVER